MAITVYRGGQVQQIERATIGLYTIGGGGKTTTALSAHNPVLLDFEGTSYRALNPLAKSVIDLGSATWEEIDDYTQRDPDQLIAGADTVILDTVTALVRIAIAGIIGRGAPKLRQRDGSPTIAGWTALRDQLFAFYERFTRSGKNVIFTFQPSEGVEGDESFMDLSVIGKSKEFVLANSDMIGEIVKNKDGTNSIDWSMRLGHVGKDPLQWGVVPIPHVASAPRWMGDEIARYISEINERKQSEAKAIQPKPETPAAPTPPTPQQPQPAATPAAPAPMAAEMPVATQERIETAVGTPATQEAPPAQAEATYGAEQPAPPAFKYFVAGDNRGVEEILLEAVAGLPTAAGLVCFNEALEELRRIGRDDFMRIAARTAQSLGYAYDKPNRVYVAKG